MREFPAHLFKTYQISSPHSTHSRPATCAEVECKEYTEGWMLEKNLLSEADIATIKASRRQFREVDMTSFEGVPAKIYLVFIPGQPCFKASTHRVSLERPEIYRAGRGRGKLYSPREAMVHKNAENWLDDFHTNQDRLQRLAERG